MLAGRYEVGRLIGSGGTARVYRAYDVRLDREVAVKIYDRDALPLDQRRRLRETTIQAGISHPGVVALLDSGSENGRTYLVMQLVEGENLAERLLGGPMPAAEVTALADGLAEALAHVHAHRVVHRDLKPANVFLSAAGPLIGDFGIAHILDTTHITSTGVVPGTAAYLAPEQVSGEPAGPPADVYALGLILLECLTGEREYAGTLVEAAMARLNRPPRIPDDVPSSLAHTLRRMTRRDPADRPTAEEVRRLLYAPAPVTTLVRRPLWRRRLEAVEHLPAAGDRSAYPTAGAHDSDHPRGATPTGHATIAAEAAHRGHPGDATRAGHRPATADAALHGSGATPTGHRSAPAAEYLSAHAPASSTRRGSASAAEAAHGTDGSAPRKTAPLAAPPADPRPARRRRMAVAGALAVVVAAVLAVTLLTGEDTGTTTTPAQPPAPTTTSSSATSAPLADRGTPDPQPPPVTSPSLEPAVVTQGTATPAAPPTTKPGKTGKGETRGKGKGPGGRDNA
ncbi:serine/threonine protein kinase [Amycolatopsis eburnea]|uniref:non-specific serine/threonine protein kinase n=1 Tax=Amycolatopsis eburnea TaxID=2267691 RepID=A0A427T299_9PSEU|nr:serine/threonine protein kinase [Amycolatopsis eburnea]